MHVLLSLPMLLLGWENQRFIMKWAALQNPIWPSGTFMTESELRFSIQD